MPLHMQLFGVFASKRAPFFGAKYASKRRLYGEICSLWLMTLPHSPCNLYVLFTTHFRLIYSTSHFSFTAFTMCSTHVCVRVCIYVMYIFVCIPHRDIYHIIIGLCRRW